MIFKPNFLFYWMLDKWQKYRHARDPETANDKYPEGQKKVIKFFNFGGSRSAKSYDAIHLIWKFCDSNRGRKLYIAVYRETLVVCKDTTLKDFKECFDLMELEEGVDYHLTGDGQGGRPKILLYGNTIEFKGYPEISKEAGRSDISYINEVLESDRKDVYDKIVKRCEMLVICDGNPSVTDHWAFHVKGEFNAFYSQTSYLDNQHLPEGLAADRESKCPWDLRDSHIEVVEPLDFLKPGQNDDYFFNGFRRRVWDKPECPDNKVNDGTYRRINEINLKRGTIDKFDWLVYSEGVPAAREGAVFPNVTWIDEFPETGYEEVALSMDFGYTADNTVLARTGYRKGMNLISEVMVCEATKTPEITFFAIKDALLKETARRKAEGIVSDELWICCESQDNYMGTNWVDALNALANIYGYNWNFFKVVKTSISGRVDLMRKFNLTFVDHPRLKLEQQNYVYKSINGRATNQPDPMSRWCDCLDAIGYGVLNNFYHCVD